MAVTEGNMEIIATGMERRSATGLRKGPPVRFRLTSPVASLKAEDLRPLRAAVNSCEAVFSWLRLWSIGVMLGKLATSLADIFPVCFTGNLPLCRVERRR